MNSAADLGVLEAAAALRDGGLDAAELETAVRRRLEDLDSRFGCYRWVRSSAAGAERGRPGDSPLWGIPWAVKANIAVAGDPTDCASRMLAGWTPGWNAAAVARLEASGATLLGATHMDEFAMGSSCEHGWGLTTRNPWAPERVAGGSSGGAAAAVAVGAAAFALGSDTGGSVRQPAHCCGVVGLKPTYGAVSRRGLVAHASSLDQIGVLARSAADAMAVLDGIRGRDPRDATTRAAGGRPPRPIRGLRVAVLEVEEEADGTTQADLATTGEAVVAAGARPAPLRLETLDLGLAAYAVLAAAEASANLARFDGGLHGVPGRGESFETAARDARTAGFGAEVRRRILVGTHVLRDGCRGRWLERAARARTAVRRELHSALARAHVLILPTMDGPAFRLGERRDDPVALRAADRYTVPASLAGLPALTLPTRTDAEGLPRSVQLVGRPDEEATLVALADVLEQAFAFAQCRREAPWRTP